MGKLLPWRWRVTDFEQGRAKCKNVKNKDILRMVCLSRVLNLPGDMDPLGHLVKLILRIILSMT